MEDCRRRPAPSAASNYRGRSLWYWILSSGSVPVSSESGLALRIAFAILPDPPGFRWIRDGRGMIEAAEDAALTGHWLRCEHSRSVIEECQRQRFRSSQALRGGGQLPLPPQIIEEDLAGFRILSSGSARLPVDPAAAG